MKLRALLLITFIIGIAFLFSAQGIFAGNEVTDEIKMENKAYSKHKKGIVTFSHKKHMDEYAQQFPDVYKNGCGECHHDENGKPLALKKGDSVQPCIECHKKPGERPKGKGAPKLSKKERLAYHAEALHYNCKDCHKNTNKKTGKKSAPTTCSKCHPKK